MIVNFHNNVTKLLVLGLAFHLVFIGSVFDCYFTSPVVKGMESFRLEKAESKRLVLIVGDGLRADLLFNQNAFPSIPDAPEVVAPHLRSIAENRGAFGISHTRVPTESRPGHVAIIGGMYEDVSAVTKGWKTNPVDFDSVFNQSRHTFSFGSPDILPMFSRGAVPGRVRTWCYDEEDEDFTKDATALDIWVLDQVKNLFENATSDATLDSHLRDEKVVFFLHLLGLDTTGHSYRPHSQEYMDNIKVVDNVVRDTEKLFSEFYGDAETSFIFTADHGMSVIGNHGDGDPDNTRTPLIAWGKGIRGPLPDSTPTSHDDYSRPWDLGHLFRRDVEQADIASLMAALIGIDWPVNSVGVLPDVDPTRPGYLLPQQGEEALARAALVNAKVILEQYRVKHELKRDHTLLYRPFIELEESIDLGEHRRLVMLSEIEKLIGHKQWNSARQRSAELIKLALEGIRYLQTYDRLLIRAIVIVAYLGWAAYASLFIFQPQLPDMASGHEVVDIVSGLVLLAFWTIFAIQSSPWTFYIYVTFPIFFWNQVFAHAARPLGNWLQTQQWNLYSCVKSIVQAALVVGILQSMVIAYTHRWIWSIGFVLMGIAWPLLSWPKHSFYENPRLLLSWIVMCLVTGKFPLLSVDKEESLYTVMIGGVGVIFFGSISAIFVVHRSEEEVRVGRSFIIQMTLLVLSMAVTASSILSLQAKEGLPLLNQSLGWIVLVVASIYPFVSRVQHPHSGSKILALFLGLGTCFVILSISVEGLFYLAFSMTLGFWVEVESMLRASSRASDSKGARSKSYSFQTDDLRIALFFLFFVQVAFFGTGNVASISSFYLEPVYRLVPVFNPFLMASLLIFKIIAPYIILAACFATLTARLNLPPFSLFLVALTLTDFMTMSFFLNVTDTGSWLEIGQSITFFCIASLLLVWSAGICAAGEYLMANTSEYGKLKHD